MSSRLSRKGNISTVSQQNNFIMKQLFLLLLNLFVAQVVFAEDTLQASSEALAGSRPISPIEMFVTFVALFLVFKLFTAVNAKKDNAPKPAAVTQPDILSLVASEVGDLQPAGANSLVGGKLMHTQDDVETYIFVAKIDKSEEKEGKKGKQKKKSKSSLFFLFLVGVVSITVLAALSHFLSA